MQRFRPVRSYVVASSLAVALLLPGSANAQLNPAASTSLRIGTELALGGLGTVAAGFGAFHIGAEIACWGNHSIYCAFGGLVFVPFAIAAVAPFAVWGAGALWGGEGGLLPTLLGSTLGTISSMLLLYLTDAAPLKELWWSVLACLVPVLGGMAGYELSNYLALQQPGVPAPPAAPLQFGFAWRI